jgi:Holliday junction resolvase RusA-like endonuclease
MKPIEATIFVKPEGKSRARVVRSKYDDKLHSFTPAKTVKAELQVRNELYQYRNHFPAGTPLRIYLTFWHDRPKSCPKSRAFPIVKPDIDNEAKLVVDALNAYVFKDDSQIVTAMLRKRYCLAGQVQRIQILLMEEKE